MGRLLDAAAPCSWSISSEIPVMGRIVSGASFTLQAVGTFPQGYRYYQTPAVGNSVEWKLALRAGKYDFIRWISTQTDAGILDWTLNGVAIVSDDQYSSPAVNTVVRTTSNVVVPYTGEHLLKYAMPTKNASSSNYYAIVGCLGFKRTGD